MLAPLTDGLAGWRMAGEGSFRRLEPGVIESHGGPGLLWYVHEAFTDFHLRIEWAIQGEADVSGVVLRLPAPSEDIGPALRCGYEVRIGGRGVNPATGEAADPLYLSGAVVGLAPAPADLSGGAGCWNLLEVTAAGPVLAVRLNGRPASHLESAERRSGHIGLHTAGAGSSVRFRRLEIARL